MTDEEPDELDEFTDEHGSVDFNAYLDKRMEDPEFRRLMNEAHAELELDQAAYDNWDRLPRYQRLRRRVPEGWDGISCGPGWAELLFELDTELAKLVPDYKLHQAKSKLGGLRFYTSPLPPEASALVNAVEIRAYEVCEMCGLPGQMSRHHQTVYCEDCL